MLNMIFNGFLRCYWILFSKISNFSMLKFLAWKFLAWKLAVPPQDLEAGKSISENARDR